VHTILSGTDNEEDEMPELQFDEFDRMVLLKALKNQRGVYIKQWSDVRANEKMPFHIRALDSDLIDKEIARVGELCQRVSDAADASDHPWPVDPILGHWKSRLHPKDTDRIDISFNGSPRYRCTLRKGESAALLDDIIQAAHASLDRVDAESDAPVAEPKVAWHHEHGWLPDTSAMADIISDTLDDVEAGLEKADAEADRIREKLVNVTSWTTRHGLDRVLSVKTRPVIKIKPRLNRNGRPAIRNRKTRTLIPYAGTERPFRRLEDIARRLQRGWP
jgi:hypothetical protein